MEISYFFQMFSPLTGHLKKEGNIFSAMRPWHGMNAINTMATICHCATVSGYPSICLCWVKKRVFSQGCLSLAQARISCCWFQRLCEPTVCVRRSLCDNSNNNFALSRFPSFQPSSQVSTNTAEAPFTMQVTSSWSRGNEKRRHIWPSLCRWQIWILMTVKIWDNNIRLVEYIKIPLLYNFQGEKNLINSSLSWLYCNGKQNDSFSVPSKPRMMTHPTMRIEQIVVFVVFSDYWID